MAGDLPDGLLDAGGDREEASDSSRSDDVVYERFTIVHIGDHRLAVPVADVGSIVNRSIEVTRVPRSPPAIVGVTDIRGQITTLVDPHVLFPDSGGPSERTSLLVFADQDQPAAMHVDEVDGVESIPEDDVIADAEYTAEEIEGTALAHPLIVGAIRLENRPRDDVVETVVHATEGDSAIGSGGGLVSDRSDPEPDDSGVVVGEFSLDEAEDRPKSDDRVDRAEPADVEIEITPILDIDRFLLASGHLGEGRETVDSASSETSAESTSTESSIDSGSPE
ncbi:chemotaxis protein CheW [Halovivax cerinus]|uniref:Chemotaxis protein CheW n=1 Tax=Halovivax cerinus TaxID=1487865 RepID=A0ABD5NKC7_9EURY|nr:chemotaxis protein CheW [Halovivax cerinus]